MHIFMCYIRALWDRDELRCQLFSDNKGASAVCSHSVMPNHARNSLRLLFCYSVLWMLMLSLNNKYFNGSIYAGMLWNLRDVTEPFHVNFTDVLKKIHIGYFYAGFCGQERDKIRYIYAGAGLKNPSHAGLYIKEPQYGIYCLNFF